MLKRLAAVFLAAGLMFTAGSASAASVCKGMSQSKCGGTEACYWVKGYKNKSGTNVKAHCRAKPNGGAAKAKDSKKKSTKKSSSSSSSTKSKDAKKSTEKDTKSKDSKAKDKKKTTKKESKSKDTKKSSDKKKSNSKKKSTTKKKKKATN